MLLNFYYNFVTEIHGERLLMKGVYFLGTRGYSELR